MGNRAGPGPVTTPLSLGLPNPSYLPLTTARCLGESRAGHSAHHSCLSWEDCHLGKAPQTSKPTPLDYLLVLAAEGNWGRSCEQIALESLEASALSQLLLPSVYLNIQWVSCVFSGFCWQRKDPRPTISSSLPREAPSPWEDKAWSWPQPPAWLLQLPLELCFVAHHPILIPLRPEPLLQPSSLSSPCKCLLCPCTQALKTQTQGRRWTFWLGGAGGFCRSENSTPEAQGLFKPVEPRSGCCCPPHSQGVLAGPAVLT